MQGYGNTMLDFSILVPFHSGKVRNFYLLVLGQVETKLIQFCISYWVNYFKLGCCLENSVDPDQLASEAH